MRWFVLVLLSGCALVVPPRRDGGSLDADVVTDRNDLGADLTEVATDSPDAGDVDADVDAPTETGADVDVVVDTGPRCDAGMSLCDGRCVDTRSDLAHCGGCDVACAAGARTNVTVACTNGRCDYPCQTNFGDCDMNAANGCETDTRTSVMHCGRCGMACVAPDGGTALCGGGVCMSRCPAGTHLCGATCASDTSPASCGMRCAPCDAPANGAATCADGACGFTCNMGYAPAGSACLLDAPPRMTGPLSTSIATGRRPVFRWEPAPRTTHTCVEFCADRACTTLLRPPEVVPNASGDAGAARVVRFQPATPVLNAFSAPRVIWWRVYGCNGSPAPATVRAPASWELYVPRVVDPNTVSAWGVATDFNGDGFGDAVAASVPAGLLDEGRVHVYPGRAGAPTPTPQVIEAPMTPRGSRYENFGHTVTSVGDIDGDGFGELAVTACSANRDVAGLFVFRGGERGLVSPAWRTIPDALLAGIGCSTIAAAGDIDGDGHGDILAVRTTGDLRLLRWDYLNLLMTPPSPITNDPVGIGIAGLGDLDDDGMGEFAVSRPLVGQVFVYRGSETFTTTTAPWQSFPRDDAGAGRPQAELFGNSLAAAGDRNGDGLPDLVIAETARTTITVWTWSPAMRSFTRIEERPRAVMAGWGRSVAANDIDGDGLSDLVVSRSDGAEITYTGGRGIEVLRPVAAPAMDGSVRAFLVRATADVNSDGTFDPLVATESVNLVQLYFGTLSPSNPLTGGALSTTAMSGFGWSIAALHPRRRAVF